MVGSSSSGSDPEGSEFFTVGIQKIQAKVLFEYPYLGDLIIEGYDVEDDGTGAFLWKGPLG